MQLITVYLLPWFFIGKDAWSDSCVTARIPRSHSICIVLPFLCYRYTLGFLIVVDVLFQVSKLFLEVFDCPEIQGVVFLQTVVNFVSINHLLKYQIHEMCGSFLHWLHPLHLNCEMYFFIYRFLFLYFCEVYCNYMYLYWLIPIATKHAKKVLASDSMGKVDFANRLLNSVLNLPDRQVMFLGEFMLKKELHNQFCLSKN